MKSEWSVATLETVCSVITDGAHNSPKSVKNGMYMASVKDFTEYGFDFENCRTISVEDYQKLEKQGCVPQKDDVLVGKDGARCFEDIIIYKQEKRPALLSSIAILRANPSIITPEFLYYTLKTPEIKKNVRDNYRSGSAIPRIVLKDFKRMPFSFPCRDVQKRITSLFCTIDDKIKNNIAINENLEQQAQVLFAEWIDGQNCPLLPLDAISTIKYGKGLPTKNLTETGYYVFGGNGIIGRYSQYMFDRPQVLVSCRGAASGNIIESYPQSFVTNNSLILEWNDYRYYEFLKQFLFMNPLYSYATGSAQPQITIDNIKNVAVPYPDYDEISELCGELRSISQMHYHNVVEGAKLSNLRDALLPKLMSGELDVSDLDL